MKRLAAVRKWLHDYSVAVAATATFLVLPWFWEGPRLWAWGGIVALWESASEFLTRRASVPMWSLIIWAVVFFVAWPLLRALGRKLTTASATPENSISVRTSGKPVDYFAQPPAEPPKDPWESLIETERTILTQFGKQDKQLISERDIGYSIRESKLVIDQCLDKLKDAGLIERYRGGYGVDGPSVGLTTKGRDLLIRRGATR